METDESIAQARIGTLLGGTYALQRLVGLGGMGAVYEARNTNTGMRVAVKVLHAEHAQNADLRQRFLREAQTTTEHAHPGIVEVLDIGIDADADVPYMVQEFLEGVELRKLIEESAPMAPEQAIELLAPVMTALAATHARGVVHRDIKPENIVVTRDAEGRSAPKLIDFGVSKSIGGSRPSQLRTLAGTTIGTPYYMSPEQVRGDASLDARSDVWAVGAVLYEMLTGRVPFDAPNYNLLVIAIVTGTPERIEVHAPAIPTALADLVHRALANDRDARFASMQEFLHALQTCPLSALRATEVEEAAPIPLQRRVRTVAPERRSTWPHAAISWAVAALSVAAVLAATLALPARRPSAHLVASSPTTTAAPLSVHTL